MGGRASRASGSFCDRSLDFEPRAPAASRSVWRSGRRCLTACKMHDRMNDRMHDRLGGAAPVNRTQRREEPGGVGRAPSLPDAGTLIAIPQSRLRKIGRVDRCTTQGRRATCPIQGPGAQGGRHHDPPWKLRGRGAAQIPPWQAPADHCNWLRPFEVTPGAGRCRADVRPDRTAAHLREDEAGARAEARQWRTAGGVVPVG